MPHPDRRPITFVEMAELREMLAWWRQRAQPAGFMDAAARKASVLAFNGVFAFNVDHDPETFRVQDPITAEELADTERTWRELRGAIHAQDKAAQARCCAKLWPGELFDEAYGGGTNQFHVAVNRLQRGMAAAGLTTLRAAGSPCPPR